MMTRALLAAIAAMAWIAPVPAAPARVLFIGNSLTAVNNVPAMVQALSAGTIVSSAVTANDFSLEDHWDRGEALKVIATGGWSTVVLQQGPSALQESQVLLIEYAKKFDAEIRKVGARTALYMVWPASARKFDFAGVSASYVAAAKAVDGIVMPVADAWQAAWRRDPQIALYGPDGFHPSEAGSYLAALVIYHGLTGKPAAGLPVSLDLPGRRVLVAPAQGALLQAAADDVAPRRE